MERCWRFLRWIDSLPAHSRWPSHPLWPTFLTVLLIVTGGYGSVFSDKIRTAFPLSLGPYNGWSWHAAAFYFLAFVAAWLFFWRQRADDRQRDKLTMQTEKLEHLIATLPPANFLEGWALFYLEGDSAVDAAIGPLPAAKNQQSLEESARHILRLLAMLAQSFDGNHPNVRYAANIMLYRPSNAIVPAQHAAIGARLRFREDGVGLDGLDGILDLTMQFSTVSTSADELPDEALRPLALPVPREPRTPLGRFRVLPGAPFAFAMTECSYFPDTWRIREWCEENGDFTEVIQEELRQYFEQAAHFRSFVSIPLEETGQILGRRGTAAARPLGVLNIHSSQPNMLKGGFADRSWALNPLSQFTCVAYPLISMLAKLVARADNPFPDSRGELLPGSQGELELKASI